MSLKQIPALFCLSMLVLGADKPLRPTTRPTVEGARHEHEAALDKAKHDYARAVKLADDKYISDLTIALNMALNAKDVTAIESASAAKKTAEKDAKAHAAGTDDAHADLSGKWRVIYQDGNVRVYVVDHSGTVSLPAESSSAPLRNGVLDFNDNKIERWTPVKGLIFVEHFNPAQDFPTHPQEVGIGVRIGDN